MSSSENAEQKKRCFVISPIGEDGSDIRKRADQIFYHVIKPIVEEKSYEVNRSDRITSPGNLPEQIIERLVNDELVIADLTFANPNVTYELGIRHMTGKPVIQIMDNQSNLPFDLFGYRTIPVDFRYIFSMDQCKKQISDQIEFIDKHPDQVRSPIAYALEYTNFRISGDPTKMVVSKVQSDLELVKSQMADIERKISIPIPGNPETYLSRVSGQVVYQPIMNELVPPVIDPDTLGFIKEIAAGLRKKPLRGQIKDKPFNKDETKGDQ